MFKIIDFWISVILVTGFAIGAAINSKDGFLNGTLMYGYFITGGWQVFSMIVHAATGYFNRRSGPRYFYHWISLIAVLAMPFGSFWILFFLAPFLAIFYTWLCYRETFIKMKRPLDALK